MQNEVEQALAVLEQARQEAEREAQENHARNHQTLAQEMADKLEVLSISRNEVHLGAGRAGPPVGLLDAEQVEARKRAVLRQGGFKV